MLVAGEASGDGHAAKLVRALREAAPGTRFEFFGSAGPRMRDEGVEATIRADDLSIMGLPEIARALPMFLDAFTKIKAAAADRRPDVVILVDFPEFNLKLAKSLKKQGQTVVYYISPQLWGWRAYRRKTIRDHVDLLLAILPFEKRWYSDRGVRNVEYVGNPLAREVQARRSKLEFCEAHGLEIDRPLVALLPGSRHKEVTRILPPMLEAASIAAERVPEIQFVIALAAGRKQEEADAAIAYIQASGRRMPKTVVSVHDEAYDALNSSDAAAVASGTATLEAGIIGTPLVVVYKASGFNFRLVRPLIAVEHFGLVNLVAGERIATELIQDDMTPDALANELLRLLEPEVNSSMREKLRSVPENLGPSGASRRAADAILRLLRKVGALSLV